MARDRDQGRRQRRRFPLRLDLRWRSLTTEEEGEGQTISMSSTGILFTVEHEFVIGESIVLWISWPVKLDGKYPLRLVARGKVVRRQENGTVIKIGRHEFRVGRAEPNAADGAH